MIITKRLHSVVVMLMVLAAGFITSCSDDNKTVLPDPTPDFIQEQAIAFDGVNSEEKSLEFVAPAAWVAEVHQTGNWLSVSPLSGQAGPASIKMRVVGDNFDVYSRSATIDIFVDGYQAYTVTVEQKSASTNDITISGEINEGVMSLVSDEKGTLFVGTIKVNCQKPWVLAKEDETDEVLVFDVKDAAPEDEDQSKTVVVSAEYSKFTSASYKGKFYIKTNDGGAVPVEVEASASVSVFDNKKHMEDEQERMSYTLVDTIQHGVFQTTFYVDANVLWEIDNLPDWLDCPSATNMKTSGTINKDRQPVTLRVNENGLSIEGNRCSLELKDTRGEVLETIDVIFAGLGSNYVDYSISIPATDVNGNPWAFEAHESTVEAEGPYNRRRISLDFSMITSADYSSIDDAPFHLIMVDGTNGIARKKEQHWATLEMGDPAEATRTEKGMFKKQLYIVANERGDADDQNKVTLRSEVRNAFFYIVPRDVQFNDLWDTDGTLKEEYANDLKLIAQKNDPEAEYKFALEGLADGSTLTINPAGESRTFNVVKGSYSNGGFLVYTQNKNGEWEKADKCCTITHTRDNVTDEVLNLTFTFTKNELVYDGLKKKWTGSPRKIRIQFEAFIGDDAGSKVIYTFYADQDMYTE